MDVPSNTDLDAVDQFRDVDVEPVHFTVAPVTVKMVDLHMETSGEKFMVGPDKPMLPGALFQVHRTCDYSGAS